jgi:Predicted membrane protein
MHDLTRQLCASEDVRRMFRFCCVGALNTGLTFFLYLLLSMFLSIYLANALSWSITCVLSYFINRTWTFRAADTGFWPMLRFVIVNLCSLGIGLVTMYGLASFGGGRIWSYVFSLPITITASYLGYRFWSFKKVDGGV